MRILQEKGFTPEDAAVLADTYKHNEEYWLDFMMHHKRELSDPRGDNEVFTGNITVVNKNNASDFENIEISLQLLKAFEYIVMFVASAT